MAGQSAMHRLLAVALAIMLAACARAPQANHSAMACPVPDNLPAGELLLFGEMHGSIEAPALISQLACSLSASDRIAVGLEVPAQDQPLIDAYLASPGSTTDVAALTASRFWQKGRDGRSSTAMLGLIEDIRALRKAGRAIDLFAFDEQPDTDLERNVAIANGIRRFHAAHPGMKIIALMGNIHAMQDEMTFGEEVMVPSGRLLADLGPVSILVAYPPGTTWACMPVCGVQQLTPRNPDPGPDGFKEGAALQGYSHSFLLPSITASPPVI